ncbi:hypothetical protein C8R44DRAFT_820106 [Mycena epipterygia]|nr:hypothetical protein C8R44DRAFT_820106 [Mycena epipterygia]
MRSPFPSRAKKKPSLAKTPKPKSFTPHALPDVLWTSILALKESADAFAPLKSVVGGVIAIWDIAERAKHSKAAAEDIARRTKEILDVIADTVPDPAAIPPPMLYHIQRFEVLLDEIKCAMEKISLTGGVSRLVHLNHNEHIPQGIKAQLDDAYRDFLAASILRLEVTQSSTQIAVAKISAETTNISTQLSHAVFYTELTVFLAHP